MNYPLLIIGYKKKEEYKQKPDIIRDKIPNKLNDIIN